MKRWLIAVAFFALFGRAEAATICVSPATGCGSSQSTLQAAINAAAAGDTIILHAGASHTGKFVLKNKGALSSYITITTDAAAVNLPGPGVRTCGGAKCGVDNSATFGPDLRGVPDYSVYMPKLVSAGGGEAIMETEAGANHYVLRHLWFPFVPRGLNTQLVLGFGDNLQNFESEEPSFIIVDQCYFAGDPVAGQQRAIAVNGKILNITNNFIENVNAVGQDSQCIAGWNGHGPLTVTNNFLECGTENFIIGGEDPHVRTYMAITGSASTTGAAVATTEASHTLSELHIGQVIGICPTSSSSTQCVGSTVEHRTIATITGSGATGSITWTPATSATPNTTGLVRGGAVLDGLTFEYNYSTKNFAWRDGVLGKPVANSATASSGGTLSGTFYYKLQAFNPDGWNGEYVWGQLSNEVSATASNQKISVAFTAGRGGTIHRLWRSTTGAGNQDEWVDCVASPCVDDGSLSWNASSTFGAVYWVTKNIFELKAVTNAVVRYNIFTNHWRGSDVGLMTWFKSVNQNGGCWFCGSSDILVDTNLWMHMSGWVTLNGQESEHGPNPPPLARITLHNNLAYDSNANYSDGQDNYAFTIGNQVVDMLIDHNTVIHTMIGLIQFDGLGNPSPNGTIRNSMFRGEFFGIQSSEGSGTTALDIFMPGYTFTKNGMANFPPLTAGNYPAGNTYESNGSWESEFVAYTADGSGADYNLAPGSALNNAGTDGRDVGADIPSILAATSTVMKGTALNPASTRHGRLRIRML